MLPGRIQQYLRSVVAHERKAVPAGGFILYVHSLDPHPYLNYAIPAPEATEDDGRELIEAAQVRGLAPRVEYLEECFPWVETALSESGFIREARLRLMTCSPCAVREAPAQVALQRVEPGSPLVGSMLTAVRQAFGEGPPNPDQVAGWSGNTIAAVVDGEVLGAASWSTVIDGMSEIGGVGVGQRFRRRGIGAALTVAATRAAMADGASAVMLTPGDDATARVYERAGFSDTTTMLHLHLQTR
jgi:ribosomal protein S18 acetylase RimI-like enzyme